MGFHLPGFVIIALIALPLLAVSSSDRPNVLFIAVDDLRPEIGCYESRALTPNIDRLAEHGLQFRRAYCNQAVCGASRLSLMTGLYPECTDERSYHVEGWRERWPDIVTLNQHFKANGYHTVGLGKIYHEISGDGADADHWTELIPVKGKLYADPASLKNARAWNPADPHAKNRTLGTATEAANVADDVYLDGQLAAEGVRQIERLAAADEAFFLAVGFTKPHLPFNAPARYWNLYRREDFAMPDNLDRPPGYPDWAANLEAGELRNYSDIPHRSEGPASIFPMNLNLRLIHGYHACVSYTDRNIGLLLDALKKSDAADNTIVVLWGDHGWKLGDHSSWCKHTNFECDTRVPLLIRHPQIPEAKGSSQALVELIDLYPTLTELCGLDMPKHLQGKSFAQLLRNPSASHREFAYSSYPHQDPKTGKQLIGHSIRNRQYRYTEWWDKESDKVAARVLTDLNEDPGETTNLLPESQARADEFSIKLKIRVLDARKKPEEI